ncbi:glycoside hydrolase domain-containing protein [Clostridium sp.]|uniref:glycoside hydrolase domain-containing protein n=1 Tax=Clostridium sp. TaxID=1506 RepID=UPI003F2ED6E5
MKLKRVISSIMLFLFSCLTVFQNLNITVNATTNEMSIINDMTTEGETNKFTYFGNGWGSGGTTDSYNGNGDEHYNDINTGATDATTKYYTIEFVGNAIEVYGHKSWNHGIVSYSIDGGEATEVSSYAANRVGNQLLYKAEGLSEGKHTLTAIATGKSESTKGKAVIQVDYAKVYHEKYRVTDINIDNTNLELIQGAEVQITYEVLPSYATLSDITFVSENQEVATVDNNGKITAVSEGETKVLVNSNEFNISKEIFIKVKKGVSNIHGSIVDTNTHYNQDKYNEVKSMGLVSKDLFAWKKDKTISEIALISKDSILKNVRVKASDFISGDNVLSSDNVITTFLKETEAYIGDAGYHNQNDISMPTGPKESVPDILYTTEVVDIGFNKVQPVWVEINVPEGTKPGIYTGTISVTADDVEVPLTFTYNVEVLDAVMPNPEDYDFDFEAWQYPYSSAEYYGVEPFSPEHLEILTPHMLKYKELGGHAITTSIVEEAWGGQTYSKNEIRYPSMIKWTKKLDGTYTFNFDDFDKWVQFNKDLGIGDKIICYSMIPWGNRVYYFDEATGTQKYITLTPGTANYETVWTQFLNALVPHLDEKGWFEDTYIGIDERANMDKAFDVVDKVKNKDGLILKKAAAMDHFSASYFNITKRVDDLSVGSTAAKTDLQGYRNFVQERKDSEKEYKTTIYTCTEHFPNSLALSMPGESYWTMLFSAAQGATGYMRWAFDAWVEDPLRDTTHWAFEAGDTSLIYPDEKNSENKVSKSSVRLEKMAEGMRDVNKLYLMAKEVPAIQEDVENLLKTVNVNYSGSKNGVGDHGGAKFATNETRAKLPSDMEALREGIKNISKKYIELKANGVERVDSIEVNKNSLSLEVGSEETLTATVLPENSLNKGIVWSTSNEAVATVSKTGKVTAISEGNATIIVTSVYDQNIKTEINVIVTKRDVSTSIAYYNFDNIEGNKVIDSWGDYDGIVEGAEVIDGKVGKALQFNNGTDNVTITSPATLSKDWTLAMWVKKGDIKNLPASIMWDGKEFQNGDKQTESIDIERDSSKNMGVHVKPGFLTVKHVVPKDEWVHLAWVNDKSTGLTVYVDGVSTGTNAWTKTNDFNAPLKVIGGRNYIGAIDEVKVYDRPLSKSDVDEIRKVPGLNVNTKYIEFKVDEKYQIEAELISDHEDKTIKYISDNEKIATVDAKGLVTAKAYGDTFVTVLNESTGFSKRVDVRVNKDMEIGYTIPQYEYPVDKQIVIDREKGQYLGQPDMILLDDDKTLITVYPKGHGLGEVLMKKSYDGGETWTERLETNPTWKNSMETPTLYKLNMTDGSTKLMQISGGPGWGNGFTGWTTSISNDNGETWSDYKEWYNGRKTIVAMASLVQLKDDEGNFIDKWMGVYHDYDYVNYRTYLTFDEDGNEQWSTPEPYLSEWRDVERTMQICEVGIFRSPDGNQLVALGRSQSHMHKSTIFVSNDEGKTWSKPRQVQGALNGERHKISYDPISGRLLITFREIILDYNKNGLIENNDWMAGEWVAWVGTYEDLINGNEGQYRINLANDYTPSPKSGDTGYAGNTVLSDGTFILNSYGNFDPKDLSNKTYIIGTRFKLGEIDNALGLVNKDKLSEEISKAEALNSDLYTTSSWLVLEKALEKAKAEFERNDIQQIEVDNMSLELANANEALVLKPQDIVISKVSNLTAKVTTNEVTLTWDEPSNLMGLKEYIIYKDGKEYSRLPVKTNSLEIKELLANTIYGFKVVSNYENGETSKPVSINIRTEVK